MVLLLCLRLQYKCTVEYKTPRSVLSTRPFLFLVSTVCQSNKIGISRVLSFALLASPSGHTQKCQFKSLGSTPAREADGLRLFIPLGRRATTLWCLDLEAEGYCPLRKAR